MRWREHERIRRALQYAAGGSFPVIYRALCDEQKAVGRERNLRLESVLRRIDEAVGNWERA